MSRVLTVGLAAALAACSIPNTAFHASADGGGGSDGHSSVLSIVSSSTAVDVDEGATTDFTVTLSQAPSAPLTVSVATTATTKLAISVPTLSFTPTNFDQPQTVTVSGLADPDTVDEHVEVMLTATGVDPVTVAATVHDKDKVLIVTDAGGTNMVTIDEGSTTTVHVHLSAQPAGDVSVTAILGSGPVTVSPSMRVFTAANYDADQVFTFTAVTDANTVSEDESLTFRADNVPDKLLSIHDVDKDVQNILVSPSSATITEQGAAATLNVSLTQQPSTNVTVTITTTTGQAVIDIGQLTFTPQNYATTQSVHVSAPDDADTADGADTIHLQATDPDSGGHLDRTVSITIKDNDVQQILEDAPSSFSATETTPATFDVTLKFKPSASVVVSVASLDNTVATASPGTLTFSPANYNLPQVVTVTGVHDNNLVTNTTTIQLFESSIGMTGVPVSITDVDHQQIVLSTTSLMVAEGKPGTFGVSLKFDPGTTVTATIDSTNPTSLPLSPSSIAFTGGASGNWATPVNVTVSPPVDTNNTAETAVITVHGTGVGAPDATVSASVIDSTVVNQYGFPAPPPFTGTASLTQGSVIAYKVPVPITTNLDSFGLYIPAGAGDYRMALYLDSNNAPGMLVAQMPVRQALVNGVNIGDISPDPSIQVGTYWIAIRVAQTTAVSQSLNVTGAVCARNLTIPNLDDPWPTTFGAAGCDTDDVLNLWINTYHQ